MVLGPVGSGKSTFLKTILREVPLTFGKIDVRTSRLGYASQSAWIVNGSIQSLICGFRKNGAIDEEFYAKVIHACALTEDLEQLPDGDRSVIGSRGITLSGGQRQRIALARAIYAREDILLLDDVLSALDARTESLVVSRLFGRQGLLKKLGVTTLLVTHSVRHLAMADELIVLASDGTLSGKGSFEALREQGILSDDMIQRLKERGEHQEEEIAPAVLRTLQGPSEEQKMDLTRSNRDFSVYKYYIKSIGWRPSTTFLVANILAAFTYVFAQVWLQWMTKASGSRTAFWLTGYAIINLACLACRFVYLHACMVGMFGSSARNLHHVLLETVFNATQSFFSSTDTGVTLNRFSQDLIVVDRELISGVIQAVGAALGAVAISGIIFASSTYMVTILPLMLLALYVLQDVYLKTSRQIRLLDLETNSPLYSHFLETLEGLPSIRAFGWQEEAALQNIDVLDRSQRPFYLLQSIQRWLEMALDLMTWALAVILMTLAIELRTTSTAGLLGIALVNLINFTQMLTVAVEGFTKLEISLGAITRIRSFAATTESENKPNETSAPPPAWPSRGTIEFNNLCASYNTSTTLALDHVNLTIKAGNRVGICGRTGSGKSTILATLLRLVEISSGSITIDGTDISTIPREVLRSTFAAIPQDVYILSGTVRTNADPTNESTDGAIIAALDKVGLWTVIQARGGLEATSVDQPLSQGQQQLFCLARAMLRGDRSKVLILDEATSNVDRETDRIMQTIIRKEFAQHTILTVAHRLDTIIDSDQILVLERGKVLEFGSPKELLKKEDGAFKALYGA